MHRRGGMLLAVPDNFLDSDCMLDAQLAEGDSLLGPSKDFKSDLCEEDDDGASISLGRSISVVIIDVSNAALASFADYDPVTHDYDACRSFDADRPAALPILTDILEEVKGWVDSMVEGRVLFYSAREDQEAPTAPKASPSKRGPPAKKITNQVIMEHLTMLGNQMQALAAQQEEMRRGEPKVPTAIPAPEPSAFVAATTKMPAVSAGIPKTTGAMANAARLLGPPPKTKTLDALGAIAEGQGQGVTVEEPSSSTDQSNIVKAISQQSQALTALVAHLAGGDPMTELSSMGGSGQGLSLSSKGVAPRERMQQDLALRRSNYFLQVQQQLFRRMHPSLPVPQTEEELIASGATMTSYLEKQGGYKTQRDQALAMWIAAHAMDSAMMGDMHGCKEFLAILVTCMEQASLDGNWSVAYLLSLLETPPSTLFSERVQHMPSMDKPFSPLVPQPWAACALAYLKEVDVLTNKKSELKTNKASSKAVTATTETEGAVTSPRRRPKFPKKPKGSAPDPKGA